MTIPLACAISMKNRSDIRENVQSVPSGSRHQNSDVKNRYANCRIVAVAVSRSPRCCLRVRIVSSESWRRKLTKNLGAEFSSSRVLILRSKSDALRATLGSSRPDSQQAPPFSNNPAAPRAWQSDQFRASDPIDWPSGRARSSSVIMSIIQSAMPVSGGNRWTLGHDSKKARALRGAPSNTTCPLLSSSKWSNML
jgi:hypothetical protein